jgi:hypothetical protein
MALNTKDVQPLDPNLKTGPFRLSTGPARMREVTLDAAYGEFGNWLYVGTAGDVSLVEWDGTTIILNNLTAGIWHPIPTLRINSSGTTALNIRWGS